MKKELEEKIGKYIFKNMPIKMEWNYFARSFDKKQLCNIVEKGLDDFLDDLWEQNVDYIADMEWDFYKKVFDEFRDELELAYLEENPEEEEIDEYIQSDLIADIRDRFSGEIYVDMNHQQLLRDVNVAVLFKLHSNYDCTNSSDEFGDDCEEDNYTNDIYHRVSAGVTLEDFANEKANDYTASNFCFVTRIDLLEYLEFKKEFEEHQKDGKLFIPKGTQYGFFSSFNGSGSQFEHSTTADLTLPIVITNYDFIQCVADVEQHYSMADVYGGTEFVQESNIGILYE